MGLYKGKTFKGTSGNDKFSGTSNDDNFASGLAGVDIFDGKSGDDEFKGIALNLGDWSKETNNGSVYDGGDGFDRAYEINVYTEQAKVDMAAILKLATFKNFEYLQFYLNWGTKAPDAVVVKATDLKNSIDILDYAGNVSIALIGGKDYLSVLKADTTADGGEGDDNIFTGSGSDKLYGGNGNDWLVGGSGSDKLYGGSGDDIIEDEAGADKLYGGSGDDRMDAALDGSADKVDGGSGIDSISLSGSNIVVDLETGTTKNHDGDVILNIENITFSALGEGRKVYGSVAENLITMGDGDDLVYTRGGNDTVYAGQGDDRVLGGSGNDVLHGGGKWVNNISGKDTLEGGSGKDKLYGDDGKDKLYGGTGDDLLDGGDDKDALYGDDGNDVISGSWGADALWGGAGADTFAYQTGSHAGSYYYDEPINVKTIDTIYDFSQMDSDRISLKSVFTGTDSTVFKFIGTKGFSKAGGEVRYEKMASDTYIYVSQSGKYGSFAIHLDDAVLLTKEDFIL